MSVSEINTATELNLSALLLAAAKNKYRFFTAKGPKTFEELLDLNLDVLDAAAVELTAELGGSGPVVTYRTSAAKELTAEQVANQNKLALMRFVIEQREAEAAAKVAEKDKERHNARIRQLIAAKQDAALAELSVEELQAQLK